MRDRAAAEGKDVLTLIREAIDAKLAAPPSHGIDPHQQLDRLNAWVSQMHGLTRHLPPGYAADASRETIYAGEEGRGS